MSEAKNTLHAPDFKHALLVESKREQISGMAYFQKPPSDAEPPLIPSKACACCWFE